MRQMMFLKSKKTIIFRNYEVLGLLIEYNGIIRNDIMENIQFYRVVRVFPQNTMLKFIKKINKIRTNINNSKFTSRK